MRKRQRKKNNKRNLHTISILDWDKNHWAEITPYEMLKNCFDLLHIPYDITSGEISCSREEQIKYGEEMRKELKKNG